MSFFYKLKDIIKSASFTSFLILFSGISTSLILTIYYSLNNYSNGKKKYKEYVEPYPYVLEEYKKINYDKKKITKLLSETWMRQGWEYEGRTTFKEIARKGEHVNVSNLGFRRNGKNNPDDNLFNEIKKLNNTNLVYFFGGSTTFGYGVPDSHTIPSYLEKISNKNLKVINFGRGYYYSQQENDLLNDLLKKGAPVPKVAIFLNGGNERCWGTAYEPQLKSLFSKASYAGYKWEVDEYAKPFLYIISKLFKDNSKVGAPFFDENCTYDKSQFSSDIKLINVYRKNLVQRKNLCEQYDLECITFIQPFPNVLNIHKHNSSSKIKQKLDLLSNNIKDLDMKIVDISDSLYDYGDHAYVDGFHYSPRASEIIASEIFYQLRDNFPNLIN